MLSTWPEAIRAWAMRRASMPAASSPMKVREAPVTPWTMAMLPASRFESWARNSVGRRSLMQVLVEVGARIGGLAQAGQDRAVDRVVALAAAGRDHEVHAALEVGIVLHAGGIEGEAGGVEPSRCQGSIWRWSDFFGIWPSKASGATGCTV